MWHTDYKTPNEKLKLAHRSDIIRLNNWSEHAQADEYNRMIAQRGGKQQNLNKYF
jgi:hypothetical protein